MMYRINPEACTACVECEKVCVGSAIAAGEAYEISEYHCLECGSCFNVCPVGAVESTE